MKPNSAKGRQTGATLIEVLVSVAVSSFGLLGMAGLMAVSAKVSHGAYMRTQAGFAAQALIESMHINPTAVAQGKYDGALVESFDKSIDCGKQACAPSQRAQNDRAKFALQLATALPNSRASLKCDIGADTSASPTTGVDGVCRLEVAWSERALTQSNGATKQSLVWIFQP